MKAPRPGSTTSCSPPRRTRAWDVAADRMNWHQVGALPVLEGQRLVGIISERDLTAALAEGADPVLTPVCDYMTPALEVLQPEQRAADAAHLMLELGIRHLPIVRSGRWSAPCRCATS